MKFFIIIFALLFAACNNHDHDHESGNDHGNEKAMHDPEPLSYTIYTDKTELFVEFKPLVVGEESKFAAHFTTLGEFFRPLTKGTVTLSLQNENEEVKVVANEPSSPGIYRLALTPEKPGNFKLVFEIAAGEFFDRIEIDSIKSYKNISEALSGNSSAGGSGNEISFLKEQAWGIEFANMPVERSIFMRTVRTTGQLIIPPADITYISAKTSGIVSFNPGSVMVGASVSRGQSIFSITGSNLNQSNISTEVLEAEYLLRNAEKDFERANELIGDKLISEKEYLEYKIKYELAESNYKTKSSNYNGSGVSIYSASSGLLTALNVRQGEFVSTGQTLAVVSSTSRLLLRTDVSQKYIEVIDNIRSASFKTPDGRTFDTDELDGKIVSSGKIVGQDNPLIPVNFEISYRPDFVPGTFVEVYLRTERIPDALVIPVSSLIEQQGVFFVFVQKQGESFEKREVTVTGSDGNNVQVIAGLNEGERVVTKGAYYIKLASMSGALPEHGHEH